MNLDLIIYLIELATKPGEIIFDGFAGSGTAGHAVLKLNSENEPRNFILIQMNEFDKVGEIIDLGVEFNIVKKSGSWFSYGDTKLGQGRDAVKNLLRDNPELMEELEQKIVTAIAEK